MQAIARWLFATTLAATVFTGRVFGATPDPPDDCTHHSVHFDGISPLLYATVTSDADHKLYLHHEYPAGCKSTDQKTCAAKRYLVPGDVVAIGKTCGVWSYVQHIGPDRVTYGWITAAGLAPLVGKGGARQGRVEGNQVRVFDRFKLARGHNIPVCEAYLQRLNVTTFDEIPQCGRPENDSVPGFTRLNRDTPPKAELLRLVQHVSNFMIHKDQDSKQSRHVLDSPGHLITVETNFGEDLQDRNLHVWRYLPPVDIDNDGRPDNVLIWQGSGVGPTCGSILAYHPDVFVIEQRAFVLKPSSDYIDEEKTWAIFGHPIVYRDENPTWHRDGGFFPLGPSMDIFQYQSQFYFDTFFDPRLGDLEGNRRPRVMLLRTQGVFWPRALGVFERHRNVTKQVCEYTVSREEHPCENFVCVKKNGSLTITPASGHDSP